MRSIAARRRLLAAAAFALACWGGPGCMNEPWFPDQEVTALRAALPHLACTLQHARLDEYAAILHTNYTDGFLGKDDKVRQIQHLFNTGLFTAYTFTDPVIRMDGERAEVMVWETFQYNDVRREQQDLQEWRKEEGRWRLVRQYQPDPSLPLEPHLLPAR